MRSQGTTPALAPTAEQAAVETALRGGEFCARFEDLYRGEEDVVPAEGDSHSFVRGEIELQFVGIVMDKQTGHLVGNTWGSRRFAEWDLRGKQLYTWQNPNYFIDYQDCQYVPNSKMLCGGVTNLPQTPAADGPGAAYELGGLAMIDLKYEPRPGMCRDRGSPSSGDRWEDRRPYPPGYTTIPPGVYSE